MNYRLGSLGSCAITDANLAVENDSHQSLRIISVDPVVPKRVQFRESVRMLSFRPGATTGLVSTSPTPFTLKGTSPAGNAIGAVIPPFSARREWFIAVIHLAITSPIHDSWAIRGARVIYSSNGQGHVLRLRQTILLPATSTCH